MIQVETVSSRSEPSDYIDEIDLHESEWTYEATTDNEYEWSAQYVVGVQLDTLIDHIDNPCIVSRPSSGGHYDEAEWVVSVYDGYNE